MAVSPRRRSLRRAARRAERGRARRRRAARCGQGWQGRDRRAVAAGRHHRHGVADGYLYFSDNSSVSRVQMKPGELKPVGAPEVIVSGLTDRRQHADKPFTFDDAGQSLRQHRRAVEHVPEDDRKAGSPGRKPCPILDEARRHLAVQGRQARPDAEGRRTATPPASATPWRSASIRSTSRSTSCSTAATRSTRCSRRASPRSRMPTCRPRNCSA